MMDKRGQYASPELADWLVEHANPPGCRRKASRPRRVHGNKFLIGTYHHDDKDEQRGIFYCRSMDTEQFYEAWNEAKHAGVAKPWLLYGDTLLFQAKGITFLQRDFDWRSPFGVVA